MKPLKSLHTLYRATVNSYLAGGHLSLAALIAVMLFFSVAGAQSGRAQRERVVGSGNAGPAPHPAQSGQSIVTGRVLYEETNKPVRGARVRISSRQGRGPAGATVTNERGEFRFEGLAAGEYYVIATPVDTPSVGAATFRVPLPTGDPQADDAAFAAARRENGTGGGAAEVSVDGTGEARVEIRVPRQLKGGTVKGRVAYEDGKPAANAQVVFLNRAEIRGRMLGPTKLSVLTDKQGDYSISGLPPGDYLVSARMQEPRIIDKQGRFIGGGLVILTYYPSATSTQSATPVHLDESQALSDVNITLVKRATHTISGMLVSRSSGSARPLAGVHVRLRNRDDLDLPFSTGTDDRFIWTDAQGRFSFDNVMDGDYMISIGGINSAPPMLAGPATQGPPVRLGLPPRMRDMGQIPERFPRGSSQMLIEKQQEVRVDGADVNNLTIALSEGGRISGRVVIEGEGRIPSRLIITSELKPGERRPSAFVRPDPDGNFMMSGVPEGPLSLDVIISPPQPLYVKSITANGVDIRTQPLMIGDGTEIRDVIVVLSSDVATLTGRVLSNDGTPLRGATVLLAPADRNGGRMSRSRLISVTDGGGRFIITAAPGEYAAVVWTGLPPSDEEAFRALAERAPRVSLQVGERKDLDLVAPTEK